MEKVLLYFFFSTLILVYFPKIDIFGQMASTLNMFNWLMEVIPSTRYILCRGLWLGFHMGIISRSCQGHLKVTARSS